ncbi:MAG: hypothetical protein K2W95_34705 [Candidatus Obscuribacterales bacterium]|nr:hypothetical protein [Candidatus Obscuribacterales bacterium]
MAMIPCLENPRNLFSALLSRNWLAKLKDEQRTLIYDPGPKSGCVRRQPRRLRSSKSRRGQCRIDTYHKYSRAALISLRHFPDFSLREICLPNRMHFRRVLPGGPFTCVSGAQFGRKYDEILFENSQYDDGSQLQGCLRVDVIGFDVSYFEA